MQASRVFLHVGPYKTGTTAVQQVLLNAGGIVSYPDPVSDGPGHHRLAMGLMDPREGEGDRNILVQTVLNVRHEASDKPIVLSSETFSKAVYHPQLAAGLYELSERFHTELVITHRPIMDKVFPHIQEWVKQGLVRDFKGLEVSWVHIRNKYYFSDGYIDRLLGLGKWRKCHIVLSDPRKPRFIIDAFSDILGVRLPETLDPERANASMPYMQMRILLGLHRENPGHDRHMLLERSRLLFSELQKTDPEKAAIPYPPFPNEVRRHFEEMDSKLDGRIQELERAGLAVVHRP